MLFSYLFWTQLGFFSLACIFFFRSLFFFTLLFFFILLWLFDFFDRFKVKVLEDCFDLILAGLCELLVLKFSAESQKVDTARFVKELLNDELSQVFHQFVALQSVSLCIEPINVMLIDIVLDHFQILEQPLHSSHLPSCHIST